MGIQDRDYWKDRDTSIRSNYHQQPPGRVYSGWGAEPEKPKKTPFRLPWPLVFVWGFVLGHQWDKIEFIARSLVQKYFG